MTLAGIIRVSFAMLSPAERRQAYVLFALIVVTGLVDALGLTSLLPFLAVLAKPEVIHTNRLLAAIYDALGFSETGHFVFFLGVVMLLALILTNAVNAWTTWASLKFSMNVGHGLSMRLLRGYLYQPYVFYLNKNSSKILVDVGGRVFDLVNGVVVPALNIASKGALAVFVFMLVFMVNPALSLVVASLVGLGYVVTYLLIREKLRRYGKTSTAANEARVHAATSAFLGIKELKIVGRESFFEERFRASSFAYTDLQAKHGFVSLVPRYILEVVAIGSMIGAVLYLLSTGTGLASVLPVLALYAFAAYRLMPAIQQIYQNVSLIKFTGPSIDILDAAVQGMAAAFGPDVTGDDAGNVTPVKFEQVVASERVTYCHPGATRAAVRDLTFSIPKNTSVGLVGATGAGKSTVLDLVSGLLEPTTGTITVDGVPLHAGNHLAWRRKLGYVPQFLFLSDDTIARNIAFGLEDADIDMSRVTEAARLAQIHDFVAGLPEAYGTVVGERGVRLSGGQRQRICIARALYRRPELLLFDEATSALDSVTEAAMVEEFTVLSGKITMLIVAHRISTVRGCDQILLFEDGAVTDRGSYRELYERNSRFRALAA